MSTIYTRHFIDQFNSQTSSPWPGYGHNALFSAAMNGNLAVVKCLLDSGGTPGFPNVKPRGSRADPLIVAAENHHLDVVP